MSLTSYISPVILWSDQKPRMCQSKIKCFPFVLFFKKTDVKSYVEKFAFAMNQYLQALSGIVPIFNYMVGSIKTALGKQQYC